MVIYYDFLKVLDFEYLNIRIHLGMCMSIGDIFIFLQEMYRKLIQLTAI